MLTPEERLIRRRESFRRYKQTEKGKLSQLKSDAKYRAKNKEKLKVWKHSEAGKEAQRRWRKKNGWKVKVYNMVCRAKRNSILIGKPCEICGLPNAFAHHDDYNKPFEVKWFCHKHHMEYHTMKRSAG